MNDDLFDFTGVDDADSSSSVTYKVAGDAQAYTKAQLLKLAEKGIVSWKATYQDSNGKSGMIIDLEGERPASPALTHATVRTELQAHTAPVVKAKKFSKIEFKPHWSYTKFMVIPFAFLALILLFTAPGVGFIFLVITALIAFVPSSTKLVIENGKVTQTVGWLVTSESTVYVRNIKNVQLIGGLVWGTVAIFTAGDQPEICIKGLSEPKDLVRELERQMD